MNRRSLFVFLLLITSLSELSVCAAPRPTGDEVVHVATALDHLTVIELGEPVVLLAAGSDAFHVERQDDKVLIKPLTAGAATDLVIWTRSRRLIYELDPAGEVNRMNFVVDSRRAIERPAAERPVAQEPSEESLMARAFLAALPVTSRDVRDQKDAIAVRVEHVLLSKNNLYLHCSIRNQGRTTYLPGFPVVSRLVIEKPAVSLIALRRSQISGADMGKLRRIRTFPFPASSVQVSSQEISPGETVEAVIALPQPVEAAALLSLTFAPCAGRAVHAFVVL